jgi:hypothetical protein
MNGDRAKVRSYRICRSQQLPQPKNLLFIEPHVTPSASTAATPTNDDNNDPLARAGAKLGATGKIGKDDMRLPNVHAEPHEYYGGQPMWSRARTFSNVSRLPFLADHRLLLALDRPTMPLRETVVCRMTKSLRQPREDS